MEFKKHEHSCDMCALFEVVSTKDVYQLRCNGEDIPHISFSPWIITRGCATWKKRSDDWYIKGVEKMEIINESHEKSCSTCKKFGNGKDWFGDYLVCDGDRFPHKYDFPIIDWIDKHGCASWEKQDVS